jgi:ERCC4-type nuclease
MRPVQQGKGKDADKHNFLNVDYRERVNEEKRERQAIVNALKQMGARVQEVELEYGDFAWVGNGPDGNELRIGVERKDIRDFVSSMRGGRLGTHQVPGMCETYDVRYILTEGHWRAMRDGGMEWGKNGWKYWPAAPGGSRQVAYGEVVGFINSMCNQAGFRWLRSGGPEETAWMVYWVWRWWQKKWDEHDALGVGGVGGDVMVDTWGGPVQIVRANSVWKTVAVLGRGIGIGREGARELGRRFKSVREMVEAIGYGEKGFMVKGLVGRGKARALMNVLQGRGSGGGGGEEEEKEK